MEGFLISSASSYFAGFFRCLAQSENRNDTLDMHLFFIPKTTVIPQVFIDDSQARYVLVDSNFSLVCIVKVEPNTKIYINWSYPPSVADRISVEESQEPKTSDSSILKVITQKMTVYGAKKVDEGIYQCNVTDHSQKKNYFEVSVSIYETPKPTIVSFTTKTDPSKPIIKKRGESAELKSSFVVFPYSKEYNLYWLKNGDKLVKKIGKHQIKNDDTESVLTILDLEGIDGGMYTLMGESSGGSTNVSFQILVKDLPQISIENVQSCCYLSGKNYTFFCRAKGFPIASISWSWKPYCLSQIQCPSSVDWIEIQETQDINDAITSHGADDDSQEIAALFVQAKQSGYYKCEGRNEMGSSNSNISFIVTDVPDGFEILIDDDKPVDLEPFSMKCAANLILFSGVSWTWKSENDRYVSLDSNIVYSITPFSTLAELKFDSITRNQSGIYECYASYRSNDSLTERKSVSLEVQGLEPPQFITTNMNKTVFSISPNSMFEFTCYVSGIPRPNISWFKDGKIFFTNTSWGSFEDKQQKLIISRVVKEDSGLYECKAENRVGVIHQNATLIVTSEDSSSATYSENSNSEQKTKLVVATVAASLSTVVLLVIFGRCVYNKKKTKRKMQLFSHQSFKEGQMAIFNPDMSLDDQAELLPYDERWEFSKEKLKLGRTLGQGAFGRVVKAEAVGLDDCESSTTVAVKMLKERADINQQKALMAELKILIHLGHHLNIVNLLGAVTKNIQYGELYMIVEYCKYGNLRHFLLRHRDKFVDQSNSNLHRLNSLGQPLKSNSKSSFSDSDHSPISTAASSFSIENPSYRQQLISCSADKNQSQMSTFRKLSEINSTDGLSTSCSTESGGTSKIYSRMDSKDHSISTSDLLCFAFQTARGMEYLSSKKLIHRDLAARNVLLAEGYIVKICDFGLAKDCYKYSNYVRKGNGPLPIKWMAIESLGDKVFTTKSDVWSFGVLLWEFFTLGGNPYPGVEVDEEFYRRLKIGYRMSKPDLCPDIVYQIMRDCWQNEPTDRPDFAELSNLLGGLLESSVRQHYIDLNDPYQEMNQKIPNHVYLNEPQPQASYVNAERFEKDVNEYDEVPPIRSISDDPVPKQAMEIVPMIRLDSISEESQNNSKNNDKAQEKKEDEYSPDYLCMANSPQATCLSPHDDDSVFF